jgi:pimeloyl-ACP methyl ester carboxylesterase
VALPPAAPGQKHGGWIFRANRQPARGVIICLHGISTHAAWFQPLAVHLNQAGYDLVCPNRPGSGENPRRTEIADMERGEDLITALGPAFAEARRHKSDVYLLGTSWGAKLAVAAAVRHREEIKGVILLVPAFKARKENLGAAFLVAAGNLVNPEGTLPSPNPEEYLSSGAKATSAAILSEISRDGMMLCRATHRFHWQSRALQKEGVSSLKEQKLPTLAMFAGEDRIVDQEKSEKIALQIANTVVLFPGEGHAIQVQTPALVAQSIIEWIETGRLTDRDKRQVLQTPAR